MATVITLDELRRLRQPVPESMHRAAGLLRHKARALERHLRLVRSEWDRHSRKR